MIGGIRYAPGPGARPFAAAKRGAGFHLPDAQAAPLAATGSAAPVAPAAKRSPEEEDDAARRRGHALLEEMEGLRRDLLRGGIDPSRLSRLSLLVGGEAGDDPGLREALEAISLRAKVEMARYSLRRNPYSP
ncbi:flagellar assembly protein FliX [Sabulicella rubraurantiaca]|uniref:flagellar assembly protein FliX n=1 Tax=Sabulicella rubraurantiaca TaxID=2811429 RepID=UPI001A97B454|nr:flagellar assembly protein FliX [Sabulicella rubraurantiaca]